MKGTGLRCCAVILGIFGLLSATAFGVELPKTMVKITTRVIEPKPESNSFAAQPRTLWRAGTRYARIAEAADNEHRIHGLMVIDEPQIWMINLYDRSGRHIIDPGPSLDVKVPIFQFPDEPKSKLQNFEFGRELEFMPANRGFRSAGTVLRGKKTSQYELALNGGTLTLWLDAKTEKACQGYLLERRKHRNLRISRL